METPYCEECCVRPVKRARPNEPTHQLIDGKRWRRFCSRECCGRYQGQHSLHNLVSARLARHEKYRQRVAAQVLATCRTYEQDGMVPIREAMRAILQFGHRQWLRGYAKGRDAKIAQRAS